ncbi:MAG: hypothetical protein NC248_08305 [Bacteroides sp.]|nr:hypothetical protein [Lachnospiraceae bacterium]MCM1332596.1 hypothetical protein [Bacteroides sp.]MCM1390941.1 hypothetical protein [Bacteroides sp.]
MRTRSALLSVIVSGILATGCSEVDDDRIPATPVNIDLGNQGYWDSYGVHGLSQYRYFILHQQPAGFPWNANTYTGFGGVLLVTDIAGYPLAYDLSCPVERKQTVRILYDPENLNAHCPTCGSVYDVNELYGSPISGPAHSKKYGLRRYHVVPAALGGYTIVY